MTITPILNKIFSWEKELLERITFKCSFHYLQLVERNLLETFADNVKKAWECGCSANIEITPDDELIPYIDEVKEFSLKHFGALPHLSIARDDKNKHNFLTSLSEDEYKKVWSQFDSEFWRFKLEIFNEKRNEYCYAGAWSLYINFATGSTTQCYCSRHQQNVYEDITKPIDFKAIGKCQETHCYNGHALLTLGCIPGFTEIYYGNIRDRVRADGSHWIQPKMLAFLNSKCEESNKQDIETQKIKNELQMKIFAIKKRVKRIILRICGK